MEPGTPKPGDTAAAKNREREVYYFGKAKEVLAEASKKIEALANEVGVSEYAEYQNPDDAISGPTEVQLMHLQGQIDDLVKEIEEDLKGSS